MIEVCIIGFGFSSIPLIRELELTGTNFWIVSGDDDSVWDSLSKHERLDFSLVSSYLTSFYSFDLAKDFEEDFFPTAKQFYEMLKRWRSIYAHKVIRDLVVKVENFKDYSLLHTKAGKTFQAKHVVIATGFKRSIGKTLCELDYGVSNKTFVLDMMGDSANLIISKLIPNNNKIIVRSHGFTSLDKEITLGGKPFAFDQFEMTNIRYASHKVLRDVVISAWFQHHASSSAILSNQFPLVRRDFSWIDGKASVPNGLIGVKYWPIERYYCRFSNDLERSISEGYILNDIAMYIHTGRVVVVPPETSINFDTKAITYAGIERSFDQYIKGESEYPRLPEISINKEELYQFNYRNTFMGVIPRELNNVYFLGFTRPTTGGLANITEMQSLFIHKLVTQPTFHRRIYKNLSKRITAYNLYYYGNSKPRKHDHLVLFGLYTEDIARLIGIDCKLNACSSLRDLMFYYIFPNNAFKYRMTGEYAIDGIQKLSQKVLSNFAYIMTFSTLLKASTFQNCEQIANWAHSFYRFSFNDMRYKEPYREFLDAYINAYRRVKKTTVDETTDLEWELLVSEACRVRDAISSDINSQSQIDEEFQNLVKLVGSLMNHDVKSILDLHRDNNFGPYSKCIDFIHQLWQPMEYDLPFLCDE